MFSDFDQSLNHVTSYNQGSGGGSYSVRAGDTLATIAANTYGDANLWYKIAQANGLSGEASLVEGTRLILPAGVMKNTHNAATFKPYDAGAAIGDTSPTTPEPPKDDKNCGAMGQILLVVVAAVVTYIVMPYAFALVGSKILAGAIAGAAGSIASQGVGVATGIQEKFDWKGVGMAAIAGGVGGAGKLGIGGTSRLAQAGRAMIASTLTQGIGVATGLQDSFSWTGVAAAGVGAGVSDWAAGQIGDALQGATKQIAVSSASALANAATRSALDGSSFGDNIRAAIPDVIGSALGGALARGISGASQATSAVSSGAAEANSALEEGTQAPNQSRYSGVETSVRSVDGTGYTTDEVEYMDRVVVTGHTFDNVADHMTYAMNSWLNFQNDQRFAERYASNLQAPLVGLAARQNVLGALVVQDIWADALRAQTLADRYEMRDNRGWGILGRNTIAADLAEGHARYMAKNPVAKPVMRLGSVMWDNAHITGGIQAVFGVVEIVGGGFTFAGGTAVGWTGAGVAVAGVGGLTVLNGIDNFQAGARTAWTGEYKSTALNYSLRHYAGLDANTAMWVEGGIGLALGGASALGTAGRLGRIGKSIKREVARRPTGDFYSVAFETRLASSSYPNVSRGRHFQEANESLLRAMESDAAFAQDLQGLGVNLNRTPRGFAPRTSPENYTWHHGQEPGVMQLVPRSQHAPGSVFQDVLHPNGRGGYSIWGK